jgi:hypothetical protein
MKHFEKLSDIVARNDGKEVKMTLHTSGAKPMEMAIDANDLEALTVQLIQLSLLCAQKQGKEPSVSTAQQVSTWPVQIANLGLMPSTVPGESLLVVPLGLFQLGLSVENTTLQRHASELLQWATAMAMEPSRPQ